MVKISDENCKSFWNMLLGRLRKITPPSPPVPKDEVLKDVGHSMSIGNLHLGVNYGFILIHYQSLLQNAIILLQNAIILLQNATVITKCDNFIAKCDSYYKMLYLLQITLFNLITGRRGEVEAIPKLRKNCSPFTLFSFVNNSYK